jgi:hypothetical protein
MLVPFAQAIKDGNADVHVAAGWGFNMFNEGWKPWRVLYQPMIDAAAPWIDAIHEHHYGGDTRAVAASYEVAYAYALSRYGRRLAFWNTECGGHLDPANPSETKPFNFGTPPEKARGAMTYMLRDILHLLALCPDKARFRATHHPQYNRGDELAFRLLKPLRGQLLHVENPLPRIWCVAALRNQTLCVALFNDNLGPRTFELAVAAPSGTVFRSGNQRNVVQQPAASTNSFPAWHLLDTALPSTGTSSRITIHLPRLEATTLTFELDRSPEPPARVVCRTQYVAPLILTAVTSHTPASTEIVLPSDSLRAVQAAHLRLSTGTWPEGTTCRMNGTTLPLDVYTSWTLDHPIDPSGLQVTNRLEFTAAPGRSALMLTASLILTTSEEPTPP